jgi:hypothetical protein
MQYANIIQNIAGRSRKNNILLIGQLVNILNHDTSDNIGHQAKCLAEL